MDSRIPINVVRNEEGDFTRDERDGAFLIIKKGFSHNEALIINRIGKQVLKASDGKHTVTQIANRLSREYSQVPPMQVAKDVRDFVEHLRRLDLIRLSEDGEMYNGKNVDSTDGFTIHRCGEGDYQRIVSAMEGAEFLSICNATLSDGDYSQLNIRARLFNYLEEFFILNRAGIDVALFSLMTSRMTPNCTSAFGRLILREPADIRVIVDFIQKSLANFKKELEPDCRRVRLLQRIDGERLGGEVGEILCGAGFQLAAVLNEEYEDGSNQIILDYHLVKSRAGCPSQSGLDLRQAQ